MGATSRIGKSAFLSGGEQEHVNLARPSTVAVQTVGDGRNRRSLIGVRGVGAIWPTVVDHRARQQEEFWTGPAVCVGVIAAQGSYEVLQRADEQRIIGRIICFI